MYNTHIHTLGFLYVRRYIAEKMMERDPKILDQTKNSMINVRQGMGDGGSVDIPQY